MKPGLWRMPDGREIVVTAKHGDGWAYVGVDGSLAGWATEEKLARGEHLGPAVIGDDGDSRGFWISKAVDLRAEVARLKRGEFTEEEIQELREATNGDEDCGRFLADQSVEYSVGEDGVERYGFETVTVFRREGREASCSGLMKSWWSRSEGFEPAQRDTREEAEAWCLYQLKPKWRPAREDGSDNGKVCRVSRVRDSAGWLEGCKLIAYEPESSGGPWVVINGKHVDCWLECEVQD